MVRPYFQPCKFTFLFTFCLTVVSAGCGQISDESRQNRRVVDAVLTAVTLKNAKELDKDAALLDKRLADGLLEERHHKAVKAIIEMFGPAAGIWGAVVRRVARPKAS